MNLQNPSAELSLERLSAAYAQLMGQGEDVVEQSAAQDDESGQSIALADEAGEEIFAAAEADTDRACPVSPASITEAILFVGHPLNEPISARQLAALMRGVTPDEIAAIVAQLNAAYEAEGRAARIVSEGSGYRMALRDDLAPLRDKFHGRVREARLTQAAVDVLALVAYNQPLTKQRVEELRGQASGAVLSQLVRRQLLEVERTKTKPATTLYRTTDRFLQLFGLESLDDLPQSQDLDEA